jgi:hypothetical protein
LSTFFPLSDAGLPPTAVLMRLKQFANQLLKKGENPDSTGVCVESAGFEGLGIVEKTADYCRLRQRRRSNVRAGLLW